MNFTIAGIGELLWDVFPGQRRLGGAPVNFACHCNQLGARGLPISCVGTDSEGDRILQAVSLLGVEVDYLQRDEQAPTGQVHVSLDERRLPTYTIAENVAWDLIRLTPALTKLAGSVDAVCFGSLAQRYPLSRVTIRNFITLCPDRALKIFDVNLRQQFYSKPLIEESLRSANVLKVSDEELPVLAPMFGLRGPPSAQLQQLADRFSLRLAACTRGGNGSILVTPEAVAVHPGFPARVVDTVGAGDAFTATLCLGLLRRASLEAINHHANAVAAFVCGQEGATPHLPDFLLPAATDPVAVPGYHARPPVPPPSACLSPEGVI